MRLVVRLVVVLIQPLVQTRAWLQLHGLVVTELSLVVVLLVVVVVLHVALLHVLVGDWLLLP
jgi:hypothetical protein